MTAREKLNGFANREFKDVVNRFLVHAHLQHVRLETFAFAFRTTDIKIAQKLHLDFLETGAVTTFATAATGIKGKCTGG